MDHKLSPFQERKTEGSTYTQGQNTDNGALNFSVITEFFSNH